MNVILMAFAATLAMWLLYIVGVQYKRGGVWGMLAPITVIALVLDVVGNYTLFALLTWDFPRAGEYTFSTRLSRLVHYDDWRGDLARDIAWYLLDPFDPSGRHVL